MPILLLTSSNRFVAKEQPEAITMVARETKKIDTDNLTFIAMPFVVIIVLGKNEERFIPVPSSFDDGQTDFGTT